MEQLVLAPKAGFTTNEELVAFILKNRFPAVHFCFTDPWGNLLAMEEADNRVRKCLTAGLGVDGSSLLGYTSINCSDVLLAGDISRVDVIHFDPKDPLETVIRIMCTVSIPRTIAPHPCDPRNVLQKVIDWSRKLGYEPWVMGEVEYYVLKPSSDPSKKFEPVDQASYLNIPPRDKLQHFRRETQELYIQAGMSVKRIHHECGPGQCEVELNLQPAMKNADDTLAARWIAQCVAAKHGWIVDTAPKALGPGLAGSGLHQHLMLKDVKTGKNAMAGDGTLSQIGFSFVAGLIKYSRDICAIFGRSSGSYERLKPGFEAPIYAAWGMLNRSVMVRIPAFDPKDIQDIRCEFRSGDFSSSPHHLAAACLAAGLSGIEEKLEPPPECNFDADHIKPEEAKAKGIIMLPMNLQEANEVLANSAFAKKILSPEIIKYYLTHEPRYTN